MSDHSASQTAIVYDGECPFCSRYVQMVRLRQSIGPVRLINARDGGPKVERLKREGYDLDEGMALLWDNQIFHGVDCIHRVALLSTGSGPFNRLNAAIFRNHTLSTWLYPVLRTGRNATLRVLGRTPIHAPRAPRMSLKSYKTASLALAISLVAYVALANAKQYPLLEELPGARSGEVFPFFSWSLFSNPRRIGTRYSIEVVDARPGSNMIHFQGLILETDDAEFLEQIRFQKTVRAYLDRTEKGEIVEAATQKLLIDNFVRNAGVTRYRLARITFNPLAPEPPLTQEAVTEVFEVSGAGVPARS